MTDKIKGMLIAGAAIVALAVGGVALANAAGGNDSGSSAVEAGELSGADDSASEQVSGPGANEAAKAALDAVGGGTVLGVEHGDDGAGGFEVEVQRTDGSYVEVNLDSNLNVVSTGTDD